ncbi:MAG: transporter substrate-binding protein [Rhodobacteraceae bacterium]|nr:transporter substrate-binding protein [Paracoccaceae bacterium]
MAKARLLAAALTATTALAAGPLLAQDGPIKIGVLEDQSGDFAAATTVKVHAIQLAADEINAAGGIAGRPVELVIYDTQSDNRRYQEFMRRVLQQDQVDVVFAGFSSASREAYRPIVNQFDGLAFYNNQYEGGVCDANMIVTGAVPEQQFSTLIPWMMETYGKNVYTIAADYNFGQISAEWVRNIVAENGGTMVGEEFIPLGVSQFSQTIQNIQNAKPDFVVTLLVGAAQASYYEQAAAANVGLPMASSVNVGQGYEHKRFTPPSLANMYVTTNYIEEIDRPRGAARRDRQGRRLLRRAVGQCLPRPQEPAHVAHDLPGQGRGGPFDLVPESLGEHRALLAGRGRLRPDAERPVRAVHAVEPAALGQLTPPGNLLAGPLSGGPATTAPVCRLRRD